MRMMALEATRIRTLCLKGFIWALVITVLIFVPHQSKPSYGDAAAKRSVKRPRLVKVQLYTYGLSTGCTTIDFRRSTFSAKGYTFEVNSPPDRARGVPSFTMRMPDRDVNSIRHLISKLGSRTFRPKSQWFPRSRPGRPICNEGGADLLIAWEDMEVVYRVPPSDARGHLPRSAVRRYSTMDMIVSQLLCLTREYGRSSPTITWIGLPEWKRGFGDCAKELRSRSLPRGRNWW